MNKKKTVVFIILAAFLLSGCSLKETFQTDRKSTDITTAETSDTGLSYEEFKALSEEEQIAAFEQMDSVQIYHLVESSDSENWPVTSYDLVTENNAKEFIVLKEYNGSLRFNLNWPVYGGYEADTIASIGDLDGTVFVSRDGGDSGYTMCCGRNGDGTLANNSQRAVPKSSATVRTGTLDIDRYKQAVDVITGEEFEGSSTKESDSKRIAALMELGFTEEDAINLMSDYNAWLTRSEIIGENSIPEGVKSAGHQVEMRYGYYGKAAPWKVSNLELAGGCGQMNTVFSWGTLNSSGLITDPGTETIH